MESLKSKHANTLIRTRVTEKATLLQQGNAYAFEIDSNADKKDVIQAVKTFYGVTPEKVRIVRNPSKKTFIRGKVGRSGGVKKAYVYLKKGEIINLN